MSICLSCGCSEVCACAFENAVKMNRESIWTTSNWQEIAIKDMKTSHIQNSINKIVRESWRLEYLPTLKEELAMRQSPLGKALE